MSWAAFNAPLFPATGSVSGFPGVLEVKSRAEATKIEAYNDFLDWITFGQPGRPKAVIRSSRKNGAEIRQPRGEHQVMLSNVADLSDVLAGMTRDGWSHQHWRPA